MDKGSGCNFIDIVSAGQILAISTESNGMQRRAQSRPYFVRDRNHSVPGGDVPDSYFPRQAAAAYFPSGLKTKELTGAQGNAGSVTALLMLKIFFPAALTSHTSTPRSVTVAR